MFFSATYDVQLEPQEIFGVISRMDIFSASSGF